MKKSYSSLFPSNAQIMPIYPERGHPIPVVQAIALPGFLPSGIILTARDSHYHICRRHPHTALEINGKSISEKDLETGDLIDISGHKFLFVLGTENDIKSLAIEISSRNPSWLERLKRLPEMAASSLPVLIQGPSGAGKEILANQLHKYSSRSRKAFISVNCAALSPSLVESELFGHKKGSFTGATNDRQGAFMAANEGTLFLDEIGDLPLELQPKILRALENQQIQAVGEDTTRHIDVRIIAATHKCLERAVRNGQFREDLFYRLNVIRLQAPGLKERIEDFEDLLYVFCRKYRVAFEQTAIEKLKTHPWPGNIRQLKNLVAQASALFPNQRVGVEHLSLLQLGEVPVQKRHSFAADRGINSKQYLMNLERELIINHLRRNHWRQRSTALQLGIPKSTFHDRLKRLNINIRSMRSQYDS